MNITQLTLKDFRNIQEASFSPCNGINIIYGDNAQGKTNFIEAIYLCTGLKSFRTAKENRMIRHDQPKAIIQAQFESHQREQTMQMILEKGRHVLLNEIEQPSASALTGVFCACLFAPSHLQLIQEGPALRRKFLDSALCVVSKRYQKLLLDYHKVLAQRNSLLQDAARNADLLSMLDVWDQSAAKLGSALCELRLRYVSKLAHHAQTLYDGISSGKESFCVTYQTAHGGETDEESLLKALIQNRTQDLKTYSTCVGAHRDDLSITIEGKSVRDFGSQGQQRSCVLALKLAEAQILSEVSQEPCVILLDDVMSELDHHRKEFLLNHLQDQQVFITCCDKSYFESLKTGRIYHMENGCIRLEQDKGETR